MISELAAAFHDDERFIKKEKKQKLATKSRQMPKNDTFWATFSNHNELCCQKQQKATFRNRLKTKKALGNNLLGPKQIQKTQILTSNQT